MRDYTLLTLILAISLIIDERLLL